MSATLAADPLLAAHAWFRDWMWQQALPFWAGTGSDPHGGFVEHLTLAGVPADVPYKRMRVQARQIYVFSQAELLGWPGGAAAATRGYRFITDHGWRPGGGWARRLGRRGGVLDPCADLYDHAFVLFALAWYARATGSDEALDWARRTRDWIFSAMRADRGLRETLPWDGAPRQQNPHMHLLEAMLALHALTGDAADRALADELVALFREHLFDAATGTLGELFAPDFSALPHAVIEPGHHYEWVWLLDQYDRQTGADTSAEAAALLRFADRHGTAPSGGVCDGVSRDGSLRGAGTRLWPQTEQLKAHLAVGRRDRVGETVALLKNRFFGACPPGTWIDQFDARGMAAVDKIPASSLYHVMMGFAELDAAAREGAP